MDPDLSYVTTVAGCAVVTSIIVEIAVRAAGPGFNVDRFGPLLAVVVGIIVTVLATAALGLGTALAIGNAVLTGLLAGAAAMGIHDFTSGTIAGSTDTP